MTSPTVANSLNQTLESLALPPELYWNGKTEPSSPTSSELFSATESLENWFYNDNFVNELPLMVNELMDTKLEIETPYDLLNDEDIVLEFYDLKPEHWTDSKLLALSSQHLDFGGIAISSPNSITKVHSASFGDGYNSTVFDTAILTQLTPPHSPPQNVASPGRIAAATTVAAATAPVAYQASAHTAQTDLNNVSPATPVASLPVCDSNNNNGNDDATTTAIATTSINGNSSSSATIIIQNVGFSGNWNSSHNTVVETTIGSALLSDDIARDVQIVDEIVNTRAQELPDFDYDECDDSISSYSVHADSTTDEEWVASYATSTSSAGSSPVHVNGSEEQLQPELVATESATRVATPKKRTRPHGRGVEDRKIRKKEQNKNAATRYRQKKKLEMEHVLGEEHQLLQRNELLKRTLAERKSEASYLKTLLREFYQKNQ